MESISGISVEKFADKLNEIMGSMSREFFKQQNDEFFKTKITMPQFFILNFLEHKGESKMTEMAKFLNVTPAALTGIVDRLVRDGYVQRGNDPDDRRVVNVNMTEKGNKLVRKLAQHRRRAVMDMFSKISQKERENYLKILMHIREQVLEQG